MAAVWFSCFMSNSPHTDYKLIGFYCTIIFRHLLLSLYSYRVSMRYGLGVRKSLDIRCSVTMCVCVCCLCERFSLVRYSVKINSFTIWHFSVSLCVSAQFNLIQLNRNLCWPKQRNFKKFYTETTNTNTSTNMTWHMTQSKSN